MNATPSASRLSAEARPRMRRPLFRADWLRTVFIHYEVEPEALRPLVPFTPDLREGRAYVSLVAFTMERMRMDALGGMDGLGEAGRWLLRPISDHGFLNVRTYVRVGNETGIYFLAEWLANRLAVPMGPPLFGLPYRHGLLDYQVQGREISGTVREGNRALRYRGAVEGSNAVARQGSLEEFLLERYSAFTWWRGLRRRFRVWHEPWPHAPARLEIEESGLLAATGGWLAQARMIGAHYSLGVQGVWMGVPQFCAVPAQPK